MLQAIRKIPISMQDWTTRLDGFLEFNGNEILIGPSKNPHEQVKLHAETEFEKYRGGCRTACTRLTLTLC